MYKRQLLKEQVIFPHDKAARPVGTVVVFLALVNRRAATGASADFFPLRGKQFCFILGNRGIGLDKPRCHFLNQVDEKDLLQLMEDEQTETPACSLSLIHI